MGGLEETAGLGDAYPKYHFSITGREDHVQFYRCYMQCAVLCDDSLSYAGTEDS